MSKFLTPDGITVRVPDEDDHKQWRSWKKIHDVTSLTKVDGSSSSVTTPMHQDPPPTAVVRAPRTADPYSR